MSYCVNCGVELDPARQRCPLCGTPAWKPDSTAPSYFPTKPAEVPPASRARGGRAAHGDARVGIPVLRRAELCCCPPSGPGRSTSSARR
ncbi:MAG: hypothetical protein ACLUEU_10705 [Oscillospiraceae bacterium]